MLFHFNSSPVFVPIFCFFPFVSVIWFCSISFHCVLLRLDYSFVPYSIHYILFICSIRFSLVHRKTKKFKRKAWKQLCFSAGRSFFFFFSFSDTFYEFDRKYRKNISLSYDKYENFHEKCIFELKILKDLHLLFLSTDYIVNNCQLHQLNFSVQSTDKLLIFFFFWTFQLAVSSYSWIMNSIEKSREHSLLLDSFRCYVYSFIILSIKSLTMAKR